MKIEQLFFENNQWNEIKSLNIPNKEKVQLVLTFGDRNLLTENSVITYIQNLYPNAAVVMGSTSGEIFNNMVKTNTIISTAVEFDKTTIRTASLNILSCSDSFELGKQLFENLEKENLQYIFVISDGGLVNGSELVKGMNANPHSIPISGGMAGDDTRFEKTVVGLNTIPQQGEVIAIGFYGSHLKVGHGSMGGWDMFGPERTITKSEKNVLFEIDGRNALDLYKEYLKNYAKELPGAALLFPLSIKLEKTSEPLVRTILSIDENKKTMTFAGDLPEGCSVRLMKANFDRIIDASSIAAGRSFETLKEFANQNTTLSILISCVGRKLVLNERIDEEVESASELFNEKTIITGFYSYGEISPLKANSNCELHNQTMTITTLCEI